MTGFIYACAAAIGITYVAAMVFLVARGAGKAFSFASFAVPSADVDGETFYRTALALLVGGGLGYAAFKLLGRAIGAVRKLPRGVSAGVALVAGTIVAVVVRDHFPRFLLNMPSETTAGGGIAPEIFNTLFLALLSTLITTPIGVGSAIYLARFAQSRSVRAASRMALDTLASLPSIVYGLFGFLVFVVLLHSGYSLFAGACVLSLLNLPLMVAVTEESIRHVPRELEDASLALGATPVQTVWRVTLPYAWPGIVSAIVLSVGRVFAESAPLIMTAGTTVSRSTAYSMNPFRGGETLAVHLWYVNSSGLAPDRELVSAGTATVLVALVFLVNWAASKLSRYGGATGSKRTR
jgi:phosphate transport system permease protein